MAKAILEFDLNEHDDVLLHKRAVNSTRAYLALLSIDDLLRRICKYERYQQEDLAEDEYNLMCKLREDISEIINYNVDLNDLE